MQLIRLIYASVAREGLGYDELMSILRRAGEHNESRAITGILCYSGNTFLQALEGRRTDVNRLYNRIIRDTRHHECLALDLSEIDTRDFADWSMKLISWEGALTAARRAVLLRHAGGATLQPHEMTARQAHGFLHELADLERQRDMSARLGQPTD